MKRAQINKILIICGLVFAGVYFILSLYSFTGKRQEIVCKEVKTTLIDSDEIQLIDPDDIESYLKRKNIYPVGKKLKEISTEYIENALQENPLIKSAECYITPTGITRIRIQQCCPKFRVIGIGNYYIDTDRKKINPSTDYTAYVPIVSGYVTTEMATGELFDFITFLEKNSFWNAQIEQIHVRQDKKIELITRVGDSVILLGALDDYESKLDKLRKLYLKGFNEIGWNRYKTIDLQYKGQIVCTK